MKLKPLSEQVMVITGATSGIGLVTARLAAKKGVRLVLVARSEHALRALTAEINGAGGHAIHVVADISNETEVQSIADHALSHFGHFDTWVNNAAVSIYGTLLDLSSADMQRLFEINFWGLVYGSRVAVRHLKERGGALINIGSALSDRAIPLQGIYCASKHAVKGFTDALRMELEMAKAPVSVTLIKPGSIDTPYRHHAKNYLQVEPLNPPPVYAPETVAKAILHCAAHPKRDLFVGSSGKFISAQGYFAPRLTDKYMENVMAPQQLTNRPKQQTGNGLFAPTGELQERGGYPGQVCETSAYTTTALHPVRTTLLLIAAGLTLATVRGFFRRPR
jgi:short-subunit dehydrogenase